MTPRADSEHLMHVVLEREQAREQLAALSPGGSPRRAIAVALAAVIEVHAAAMACPSGMRMLAQCESFRSPAGRGEVTGGTVAS